MLEALGTYEAGRVSNPYLYSQFWGWLDRALALEAATPDLDTTGIEVRSTAATVVLSGTSRTALAKSTAESVALKTPGVQAVRNEISVLP